MSLMNHNNLPIYIVSIGGMYVTNKPMILQTVLGSCISLTVFDYKRRVGGMNHIVLPGTFSENGAEKMIREKDIKYGIFGIEALFHKMRQFGCTKKTTEVRLFGASYMGNRNMIIDVPKYNVDFARAYLAMAKIQLTQEVVLHEEALKILLNTQTGEAEIRKITPL